jgi:hypothetical protein
MASFKLSEINAIFASDWLAKQQPDALLQFRRDDPLK